MKPIIHSERVVLLNGDSSDLGLLGENTVDAIVTDPPAGISFMGKGWDGDKGGRDQWVAWLAETLAPSLRALKPGGHALVWAIPRTSHWTATALELAGFEIRDRVSHFFGTGFPKSRNVALDIDNLMGAVRVPGGDLGNQTCVFLKAGKPCEGHGDERSLSGLTYHATPTTAGSPEAREWEGWGTALKPACEDWWLARKPFKGTISKNLLTHGTGALNIDGCRIGDDSGRFPAHLTLSHSPDCEVAQCAPGCPVAELDSQSGIAKPGKVRSSKPRPSGNRGVVDFKSGATPTSPNDRGDGGGASRFFYVAKPHRKERDRGCEDLETKSGGEATGRKDGSKGTKNPRAGAGRNGGAKNFHPTVKSLDLMRWLIRLITPPGGVVLDPFTGSGSTGVAALEEGMSFIGCEQSAEYCEIAKARIEHVLSESESFQQEKAS
jgi:site-specific DNA-methyltransferase (adenine-specific)